MFVIPNQSSVPKAYTQFTDEDAGHPTEGSSRMIESGNRMRVVDCMEEFVKYTILMRPHFGLFGDRCSEREERAEKERKEVERKKREMESEVVVNGVEVGKI
jgi:arsenic resistance protein ArsH